MTPMEHLELLTDLRCGKPGASDRAANLLVAQADAIARLQHAHLDATSSLMAVAAHLSAGKEVDETIVSRWTQDSLDAAKRAEANRFPPAAASSWCSVETMPLPENQPALLRYIRGNEVAIQATNGTTMAQAATAMEGWTLAHFALVEPNLMATPQDLPGWAAGMRKAAQIVREGYETPDPDDNNRSTIMVDWDDMEHAAQAIEKAIGA